VKFTKIRLTGATVIDLPIVGGLPTDMFQLKKADGLGPPEMAVHMSDSLNAGSVFQLRRTQTREIVLQIGLNPDYYTGQTAESLRTTLYGLLTPGPTENILISIMDGATVLANTTGYAKIFEIVPFSREPMVQITFACTQPYFESPTESQATPTAEGVPTPDPHKLTPTIINTGTAPTGFKLAITFTQALTSWWIKDSAGRQMLCTYPFAIGHQLEFRTTPGGRYITIRIPGYVNGLYTLSSSSIWLMLHAGVNNFTTSSDAFDWYGNPRYYARYWGI
jgi:hypothetical protein